MCNNGEKDAFTNEDGLFECSSLPINFFIGEISLGKVNNLSSDKEVHIQDIVGVDREDTSHPEVLKIATLLQSLDNDQNPNNGIKISQTRNNLFTDDVNIADFDLTELVKKDPTLRVLVSEEDVLAHLNSSTNIEDSTDRVPPVITLTGESTVTVIQNSQYTDAGATATDNIDGTVKVSSSSSVDTSKVGTYTITYTATDNAGNEASTQRTVKVIAETTTPIVSDTIAPVITIEGNSTVSVVQNSQYTDAGATAKDNVDGTVKVISSGSVDTSTLGTYTITYTATDKAGNKAIQTREVIVTLPADTTAPVITITGDNPFEITQGETFSDPGATATDDRNGTVIVTPTGTVDMDTEGSYTITYTATDEAGNEANATRTVIVKPADVVWNVSTVTEFRQALEDAAANGENDRIVLTAGTYNTTSDGLGTFTFNDNEEFNLTIESLSGTHKDVVLDGNGTQRVFNFNNTKSATLIFKAVSVTNGNSSSTGGGIYSNKNIEIEDCNISNNVTSSYAGGFYSQGTATITNSTITNNSAYRYGGGFYSSGATVTNSTIANNSSNYGGGFHSNGTATITNTTITNNSSSGYGGGFYSSGNATVTNSTIANNSSRQGGGFKSSSATVTNSTITNNSSLYDGGGFYSGNATVTNSTIANNSGSRGGGFYSSGATVTNSIFTANKATTGAIFYSYYSSYSWHISNNNFIGNKGSIYAKGIFINNIFDNNDKDITLVGESKIYNNYTDYHKIEENGLHVIKKNNLQPASVGDLYLNDDNKTLASNSPVIDKGLNPSSATYKTIIDNDNNYNKMVELLKTDMLGNKRVYNGTIDMGAVEYGSGK